MADIIQPQSTATPAPVLTPAQLLAHWQGHRALTRKLLETYPDDKLFTYSIGGMRPFAALLLEMLVMGAPGLRGMVTGTWPSFGEAMKSLGTPATKVDLLRLWDETTASINELWPQLAPQRFQEEVTVFGMYKGPVYWSLLYFIDNEIHHRGPAYVYLRSLGIEPPPFWARG